MTAATTIFNTVIEPAAKRRRSSSYTPYKREPLFEEKAELVWDHDEDQDLLIGFNSLTDEEFCQIVAYYKVGMYPTACIYDSYYFDDLGYEDQIFSEESDAADFGDELLAEMGVDNRMGLAVKEYSSGSFSYADDNHPEDKYVMLTVGCAELWIDGDNIGKWDDDIRTEAFQLAKDTAQDEFERMFG